MHSSYLPFDAADGREDLSTGAIILFGIFSLIKGHECLTFDLYSIV